MKRIDFNDKFTKLVDEAYNEIVKTLKSINYDKEKGFNICDEENGIYAERNYTDRYDIKQSDIIEAIRISPNYENVLEYRLANGMDEWHSDWYEENLIDIIPVYDALYDTLNKEKEDE